MADLTASLRSQKRAVQPRQKFISGRLGIKLNGATLVNVPNRSGYVYVRLLSNDTELIEAYNGAVSPVYDLPVLLVRDKNQYSIYGRDLNRYNNWGEAPYLPNHGSTHTFDRTGASGGDVVWVKGEQFYPLGAIPSGTYGGPGLYVLPHAYNWNNTWRVGGGTGTISVVNARPTTPGTVRLMLLALEGSTGNPHFISGSEVSAALTQYELVPYYPAVDMADDIPLAIIRLETGTVSVDWTDLYDCRQYFSGAGGGDTGVIPRTVVSDPQDGTPASRPAGTLNEVVSYDDGLQKNLYFCDNAATPSWKKLFASAGGQPTNDDFDSATVISSVPYTNTEYTAFATKEWDDPVISVIGIAYGRHSIWYKWTPGASGTATIKTEGSDFDTVLALWTGTRGSLTEIASDDDGGIGVDSKIIQAVTSGTTYYIEVCGLYEDSFGKSVLSVTLA